MFFVVLSREFLFLSMACPASSALVSTTSSKNGKDKIQLAFGFILMMVLISMYSTYSSLPACRKIFVTDQDRFALAFRQSFGFFTDITDEQWEIAQKLHAKTFPNHFHPKVLSLEEMKSKSHDGHRWYSENFQEEFHCALAQRIPSTSEADGPKWVCDPHRIAKQKQCLVYSFGCYGNVAFERGVKHEIGDHCEIHTFDIVTNKEKIATSRDRLKKLEPIFTTGCY